jgi:hypothetical protein
MRMWEKALELTSRITHPYSVATLSPGIGYTLPGLRFVRL